MARVTSRSGALFLGLAIFTSCRAATPVVETPGRRNEAEESARRALAAEQSIEVATLPARTLGVPPFDVSPGDTLLAPLAYGLADLLMTDLARSSQLQIVDRLRLDALLRELDLVEAGRVDTTTAPRLGKLVGARRLVLGALTRRSGARMFIDADVADVASGEVESAVSAGAPVAEILRAEKELAFRLFDALEVNLTPAERAAVEQLPTKNVEALLAYSRGVRYEVEGRYGEAAEEHARAVQMDPGFQAARTRLKEAQAAAAETPQIAAPGIGLPAALIVDRVNNPSVPTFGGPQDPSVSLTSQVNIRIIITVPE